MIAAVGAHHQVHIQVVAARLPQHGQHSVHLKAHAVPRVEPALGIIVIKTTVTNPSLSGAGYSGCTVPGMHKCRITRHIGCFKTVVVILTMVIMHEHAERGGAQPVRGRRRTG